MFNEALNFHYTQHTALFMTLYYTDSVWSVKVSLEGYYLPGKDKSLDIYDHWSRKLSLYNPVLVTWASHSGLNVRLCSTGSCTTKLLEWCSCAQMVHLDAAVLCTRRGAPEPLGWNARLVWSDWGLPFIHRKKTRHLSTCFRATYDYV